MSRTKPTALKILQGNPGKRALNHAEPRPDVSLPSCPKHLDDVATAEWVRITPELLKLGLLSQVDRSALAAYCQAYSRWVAAEADIAQDGLTFTTDKGMKRQNPAVQIAEKALGTMRLYLVEFGMTPASRPGIKTAETTTVAGLSAGARKRG